MTNQPKVSVVLSFRNEEDVLDELIQRIAKVFASLGTAYEMIFVNDASTDRSFEILSRHSQKNPSVKCINMSRTFGIDPCFIAGVEYSKGDAVILMDADLQDPPEMFPKMIAEWQNGADIVHTTRTDREGEGAFRMFATKIAYRLIGWFSQIEIPKDTGNFKLISRRAVKHLLRLKEKDPYLRGLVTWVGFKQAFIPYVRERRFAGKSHYPLFSSWGPSEAFIAGIISFSVIPLYFCLMIGFFVSLCAFLYMIFVIISKLLGYNLPGWSAIMSTLLFLGGTQLTVIGVQGLYLGRIYNDVKARPLYIVESTLGFDS